MEKVKKNFVYNIIYHVVSLIIPLIVNPYITRTISQELLGRNTYICAQITYFCLFGTLGINYLGTREIAKAAGRGLEKVRERFYSLYHLQFMTYLLMGVLFTGYLFLFPNYLSIKLMYILMLVSCMTDINWLYMGLEKFQFISIRNCLIRIICTLLVFLLVKNDGDINLYITCLYLPQLVLNILMWAFARRKIGKDSKAFKIQKEDAYRNLVLAIPGIAISFYTVLDKLVLGLFQPVQTVAIYDQGQSLVRIVLSAVSAFGTAVMPRVSGMIGKDSKEDIQLIINKCSEFTWFLSVALMLGFVGVVRTFISWYLPAEYAFVSEVVIYSAPLIIISSAENIMGVQILIPHGGEKYYSISLVVAAITNLALDLIFVPRYGIVAACICSVVAESAALIIQICYAGRYICLSGVFNTIPRYVAFGILMLISLEISNKYIEISVQAKTLILVTIGAIIYLSLTALGKKILRRD